MQVLFAGVCSASKQASYLGQVSDLGKGRHIVCCPSMLCHNPVHCKSVPLAQPPPGSPLPCRFSCVWVFLWTYPCWEKASWLLQKAGFHSGQLVRRRENDWICLKGEDRRSATRAGWRVLVTTTQGERNAEGHPAAFETGQPWRQKQYEHPEGWWHPRRDEMHVRRQKPFGQACS